MLAVASSQREPALAGPELTFLRARIAEVQADSPEFRAGWLDNGEANLLRRSRSSRGDVAQAATLVTECLKELPGHQGYLDFAVEVSAELPPRARELLSERARILGDAP